MGKPSKKGCGVTAVLCTIICSWVMACGITLVLIDQDPYSHAYLLVTVRSLLQSTLQTPTSITFHSLRLALGKATVSNLQVAEPEHAWSWHSNKLTLHFSLWNIIKNRSLDVKATLTKSTVTSTVANGDIAIAPVIKQLFSVNNAGKFINVTHVTIIDNDVTLIHDSGTLHTRVAADLPLVGRYRTSFIWWHDGNAHYKNYPIIANSHGSYRYDHEQKTTLIKHETTLLPTYLSSCILQGTLSHEKGTWNFQSSELAQHPETLRAHATINHLYDIVGTCTIPLVLAEAIHNGTPSGTSSAQGTITCNLTGNLNDLLATATVNVDLDNGVWNNQSLPRIAATITNLHDQPKARIDCPLFGTLQSKFTIKDPEYTAHLSIPQDCIISSVPWHIKGDSSCKLTVNKEGSYRGSYILNFARPNNETSSCTGTFQGSLAALNVTGSLGSYNFSLGTSFQGVPRITNITLTEQDYALLQLHEQKGMLRGSCDIRLLSLASEQYTGSSTLGEGLCNFEGIISAHKIDGSITLASGSTIRIPHLYNILEALHMHVLIDLTTKKIAIDDVVLNFHQGTIHISQAQGVFNNQGIEWAIIPCRAHNCLMSWHKDLFALISGAATIIYSPQKSLVQGFLVVEKGHIRTNILSPKFPTYSSGSPSEKNTAEALKKSLHLDIHCMTRKPIQVKTPFLETQVGSSVHLQGTTANPMVNGNVALLEGSLLFPYKPLFIRQGIVSLHSAPGDNNSTSLNPVLAYTSVGYEPYINLIAENTIKGYRIRMEIQGPLQSPDLTFSANPHLPTEQIIALLFGGSEDGSIYVAMSTYIMQSIKDLLFGPPDSTSTTLQSLKNLFRPLGSVRFVPSFTDQSSRGGIRGSLAIEVNERLRGIIKQNFDLPQDVMLEVEYDLSDDARIRAIKDERGDLGAEIEASWKF